MADIDRRSTDQERVRQSKPDLREAEDEWLRFRDVECQARAAANVASARPQKDLVLDCLSLLTRQRIEDIKKY
jgi:uncharacterized protein YecT (DUF1311 family)